MKIGYRTIKTAIGVPLSMYLTQLIGVSNYASSGILTLLCIQPSRKKSIMSAWDRFTTCMLALIFSYVFFETLGYNPFAIGVMLLIFIPITVHFNIHQGLVTSIVIILNIYMERILSLSFVIDQITIIVVGVGIGLLLNLYMPNLERRMRSLKIQLEDQFKKILLEISHHIIDEDNDWDETELKECAYLLKRANSLGSIDEENHLLREEHPYTEYFQMRNRQFSLLESMLPLVKELPKRTSESIKIARFFKKLSKGIDEPKKNEQYLDEVRSLKKEFEYYELPSAYEYDVFATRANLFRLLHEMEAFLLLNNHAQLTPTNKIQRKKHKTEASE